MAQWGSVIVNQAMAKDNTQGFDAYNLKWVDMFRAGIIDPAKVVRCALQNASSIAGLLLTTEALIYEVPEEKSSASRPSAANSSTSPSRPR